MGIKNKKIHIIGSGLTGSIIARELALKGYKVTIYEKRNHIGGNLYDYKKDGVLIHKYGPHIFHTSNEEVINYMNQFWKLNSFKNIVEGYVDTNLIPIPFNFKSIDIAFPEKSQLLKNKLKSLYPNKETIPILELKKTNDLDIKKLAEYVYNNLFLNYTTKMWNLKPDEIDDSVTARIPIILSYRDTYFNDKYEGLPEEGYTKTFEKILNHENIEVLLNIDATKLIKEDKNILKISDDNEIIIFTGPLDKLFNNKFGPLEYRLLFFEFESLKMKKFQKTAVVNYPAHPTMTRITEYKNMTFQKNDDITVISKEYPGTYNENDKKWNEPYYPLATENARNKYKKYSDYAKQFKNLYVSGRMGMYKYINMDQAIEEALKLSRQIIYNLNNEK